MKWTKNYFKTNLGKQIIETGYLTIVKILNYSNRAIDNF